MLRVFERREWIEFLKIKTLVQAFINPDKAGEAVDNLGSFMIPKYSDLKKKQAKDLMKSYKQFRDKKFSIAEAGDPIISGEKHPSSLFKG